MNSSPSICPVATVAPTSVRAFEALYAGAQDPWQFSTSDYEQNRYRITLAALRRTHYPTAFEPGCSIGELSAQLATRCGHLEASDFAPTAVARAKARCKDLANVTVVCADLTETPPTGPFDLVVFSEIGYYFEEACLRRVSATLAATLTAGGEFIAVHWLGTSPDHILHGDRVHEILRDAPGLTWIAGSRQAGFRVDSWGKT